MSGSILSKMFKFIPLLVLCTLTANAQIPSAVGNGLSVSLGSGSPGSPDMVVAIEILMLMTVLALAPALLIMTTSFTRIIVVLHFIRQALGTQQLPPNQLLIGLALFLTFFIMKPALDDINANALQPYLDKQITQKEAFSAAQVPLKNFMLKQTRTEDLALFIKMSRMARPTKPSDLPMSVIMPGFMISELRIGFQIGFLIYLPFLVIDMVIASVLMSMGMMMLPPIMISLPFKVLLFVLVDGWSLLIQSVVAGFRI
jgi:flagellar biosynthesis protein FliP